LLKSGADRTTQKDVMVSIMSLTHMIKFIGFEQIWTITRWELAEWRHPVVQCRLHLLPSKSHVSRLVIIKACFFVTIFCFDTIDWVMGMALSLHNRTPAVSEESYGDPT